MTMRTICLATTGLVLGAALTAAPGHAANLDASSTVDAVTVYPDGATVTRIISLDLPAGDTTAIARDFPLGLDVASLRVEGEAGAKLMIGSVDAKPPRAVPPGNLPEIDRRIEALKDERANIDGAIAAALARKKFVERFADGSTAALRDKGEARPIAEWRTAFAAVGEEIGQADATIREAERKQRDLDREIARLQADRAAKPPSRLEVQVELSAAVATRATLRVTYVVRNARWVPVYDARLDTSAKDRKSALELVRRAEIQQSTGEDWSDVALAVSTVRTDRGSSAPELRTMIAQYPPTVQLGTLSDRAMRRVAELPAPAPEAAKRAEERETTVEISAFQTIFRVPGRVSVAANEGAKSLRISTATITPELVIRAAPVVDPTAYIEASFVLGDDAPLLPGKVSIYRDGMFVGTSRLASAGKDEVVHVGFGADDKVKVERSVVKRNEGSAGLIVTTAKIDERAFKTTVRNAHEFPIKVAIQDQLPVSENEEITVEMLPATTPPASTNVRDRRGVVEWVIDARPGEAKDIAFAWRVRWPKDKSIVLQPSG
ncbi:mucoidy inhibitor MuiA family protein [Bradyrhizobium sp. SZCCHNS3051]|uniref:mucoidy inhibitor MuiA family protein n=1 Tax=Bradyrhizobium sp. SZCCHNS3051 TaxID=3057320 RepID=UPI002915D263|nr:mucoidy inhibitor MuiA family protein [Bradyrhizobium sp. SZCCHNS3051]